MGRKGFAYAAVVAVVLALTAVVAEAESLALGRIKHGASGQTYVWQAGGC